MPFATACAQIVDFGVPSSVANRESNRWAVLGTPLGRRSQRDGFDAAVVASVAQRGRLRCRSSLILPIGRCCLRTLFAFARASILLRGFGPATTNINDTQGLKIFV